MDLVINNKLIDSPIPTILEVLKEETNRGLFAHVATKGENVMTNCPCHKNGLEKKPSCSIYNSSLGGTQYGWVHCFACGYNAPLYKMVGDVFGEDENFGKEWLLNRFGNTLIENVTILDEIRLSTPKKEFLDESILKQYQHSTPYWASRHISDEIVTRFELGYDIQHDMVVFPMRDASGRLVMLTKRSTKTKFFQIDENKEKPVYLLYYCIRHNIDRVVVCESQINALTLWSWGIPAIALVGTGASQQYKVLKRSGIRHYILAFDGDAAGDKGAQRFILNMSKDVLISIKRLPRGKDVNDLTQKEFESLPEDNI